MFKATIILFTALILHITSSAEAIKCYECETTQEEESCNDLKTCNANVLSCTKEEYYKNKEKFISKGCHPQTFAKGETCEYLQVVGGNAKGDKIRCVCTGDQCNSGTSLQQNAFLSFMFICFSTAVKRVLC